MDYKHIHDCIIERAKKRIPVGYTERHHIVPKSLGGLNNKENLVKLTAKEHWLIHLILCEVYPHSYALKKAVEAMMRKSSGQERDYIISGSQYQRIKKECAILQSQRLKGKKVKPFTDEHKANISKVCKGRISLRKGAHHTEEAKLKIGLASKGRNKGDNNHMRRSDIKSRHPMLYNSSNNPSKQKIKCEHCEVLAGKGNYAKWHGKNCKKLLEL